MNDLLVMSQPANGQGVPTMSSREIAEYTGKRHPDVKRDIETMFSQLQVDARSFAHIYHDSMSRPQMEFQLPKRECMILVSGYNVRLRAAIVDRWQELENAVPVPVALTNEQQLANAVLLATSVIAQKNLTIAEQAATIVAYKPSVDFASAVMDNTGDLETIQEFSARTKLGQNKLFALLREERIITRTDAGHQPQRNYIERKYFVIKEGTPYTTDSGRVVTYKKVLITKRGLAFMWKKFGTYLFDSESAALNTNISNR